MSLYLLLSVLFLGELGEDMFNLAADMLSVCDRHFRFSHSSSYTGVAQYRWDCTAPNDAGQRYIPSARDRNVLTTETYGNNLNIYHVQNLNANCHGEVTAIEYCYRYNVVGQGDAVINWTVLILEESGGSFMITNVYVIQSHPHLVSSENCTDIGGGQVTCCDAVSYTHLTLPTNREV